MLVLSRRLGEKLLFPAIRTAVQVVSVKSGAVRLGIEAPPGVTVLREEVAARAGARGPGGAPPPGCAAGPTLCQLSHLLRDWLDVAAIGLALLRRQGQAGTAAAALDPFDRAIGALREQMQGMGRQRLPDSRVLLAWDEGHGRESLAGLLHQAGLRVAAAGDSGAVLDYLDAHGSPDVLLLDMGLPPPCDGPALVRTIRRSAAYGGLKIYGVTARGPAQSGLVSGSRGVDHWFNTPLDSEEWLHALNRELADVV